MAKGKILKTSPKKRGRKGKGRKAISPEIKAKAKAAGFTSVKKWEEAGKPGPKRKQKKGTARRKDTKIPKGKRGREIAALKRASDMERMGEMAPAMPRRRNVQGVAEGPNRPALSKVELPKMSKRQTRQRRAMGLIDPATKRNIGEFSDEVGNIAEAMGLNARGAIDKSEIDELVESGLLRIKRKGGQISYKKKGGPIGVGKALGGYGKVRS